MHIPVASSACIYNSTKWVIYTIAIIKFKSWSKHLLACANVQVAFHHQIMATLHYLNIIFTFCAVGIGVGIPVTFMLTAIISSLLTLLITYLCLTRGKCLKSTFPVPVYDPLSSDTSIELKSNVAYHRVTTWGHVTYENVLQWMIDAIVVYDNWVFIYPLYYYTCITILLKKF